MSRKKILFPLFVNNASSAPFARSNRATKTDERARAKRKAEPLFDGVSRAHKTGAAYPSILACTNHSR